MIGKFNDGLKYYDTTLMALNALLFIQQFRYFRKFHGGKAAGFRRQYNILAAQPVHAGGHSRAAEQVHRHCGGFSIFLEKITFRR